MNVIRVSFDDFLVRHKCEDIMSWESVWNDLDKLEELCVCTALGRISPTASVEGTEADSELNDSSYVRR